MKWTQGILVLTLAVAAAMGIVAPASARVDRYDGYRYEYYRGSDAPERHRRQILRDRMYDVADRVRLANRERDLSRRDADRVYDRLDTVRDFIRGDRYLSDSEFRRRMDDLDEVEDILRRAIGDRYRRYSPRRFRRDW